MRALCRVCAIVLGMVIIGASGIRAQDAAIVTPLDLAAQFHAQTSRGPAAKPAVKVPRQGSSHAKWTVMVYVAANNNLEPNSIINLMEMAAVGSTPDVNIVVQITRPPDYQGFYGEWGGTRRFLVTKSDGQLSSGDFQISPQRFADYVAAIAPQAGLDPDVVQRITRGEALDREVAALQLSIPVVEENTPLTPLQLTSIEDLGTAVNSGDHATLADFGTWAAQAYPADHYGLIMWNHGGGWSMIASDDTLAPAGIAMPAFSTALAAITQVTRQKFDFVGFDACLMSQLAVAAVVAPFAEYQIAAEELVPGIGWDYTAPLAAMVANPDISVPDFAKAQIDAFQTLYSTTAKEAAQSFDMGLTDLSKVGDVVAALDTFADAVKAAPDQLGPISTARANAQVFGVLGESADAAASISAVDLIDFMKIYGGLTQDEAVKSSSASVITAVEGMVLYHKASRSLPKATGLAVYFPQNAAVFAGNEGVRYRAEFGGYLASWQGFLDATYGSATASAAATTTVLNINAVTTSAHAPGSIHDTPVVSYTLDGRNIVGVTANIIYKVDETTRVVLDQFPVVSAITTDDGTVVNDFPDGASDNAFYWNARLPSLADASQSTRVLMTTNAQDDAHGFIHGRYTNRVTGEVSEGSLVINLETFESSAVWAASGTAANAPVAQVYPKPGDRFEPDFLILDAEGNATWEASGTRLLFGKGPLTVTEDPGPDGQYLVALEAEDAAGGTVLQSAEVDIANDGLDPALQGFKDLSFGLQFLYPADWTNVDVYQREDGLDELSVSTVDGEIYLAMLNYKDVTSLADVEDSLLAEVDTIRDVTLGDLTDDQMGDHPATSLTYVYSNADGDEVYGISVAVYVPETRQGYVLLIEAPVARYDEAGQVIDDVLKSSQYFAPQE